MVVKLHTVRKQTEDPVLSSVDTHSAAVREILFQDLILVFKFLSWCSCPNFMFVEAIWPVTGLNRGRLIFSTSAKTRPLYFESMAGQYSISSVCSFCDEQPDSESEKILSSRSETANVIGKALFHSLTKSTGTCHLTPIY